jgi:rSAM/selenodomain-associated transferase 2
MISVVIPTLNVEASLAQCLTALVPAVVDGLVREVIVVDGGSSDRTLRIADQAGCDVIHAPVRGRGPQLIEGARAAKHPWLLFLHADTVLSEGWVREVQTFVDRVDAGQRPPAAAMFSFALDDMGFKPRVIEYGVALRCTLFRMPYGDQGLLISRQLYQARGGYRPLALMEDVDFVRRLARGERVILRTPALTSAIRYKRDGYAMRALRNLACLALYAVRAPAATIERLYRGQS